MILFWRILPGTLKAAASRSLFRQGLHAVLFVDELALVAVSTLARGINVPLLAHFSLIVLVGVALFDDQLDVAMSVGTLSLELTTARPHVVLAQLSLVIDAKVFNILDHFLPRCEVHLFLLSLLLLSSFFGLGEALRQMGHQGIVDIRQKRVRDALCARRRWEHLLAVDDGGKGVQMLWLERDHLLGGVSDLICRCLGWWLPWLAFHESIRVEF